MMAKNWRSRSRLNDPELGEARPQVELDLGDAMTELKRLDPHGWERWYDHVIPNDAAYADILPVVRARVAQIRERRDVQAYLSGKPAGLGDMALRALETKPLPERR